MKKNIIKDIKKETIERLRKDIEISQIYLFTFLQVLTFFASVGITLVIDGNLFSPDLYITGSMALFQIAISTYIAFFKSEGIFSLPNILIWSYIFTFESNPDIIYYAYGLLFLGFIGHIYYKYIKKGKK